MNILLIYASIHHGNTKEIAQAINSEIGGKAIKFTEAKKEDVINSDLVGFGSGIYMGSFHKGLLSFIKELPKMEDKKAFLFSTSGITQKIFFNRGQKEIKNLLEEKGFEIIDQFNCLGHDTYGLLKFIGGINKGRPNKKNKKENKNQQKKKK